MNVNISFKNLKGKGFGAFLKDSVKNKNCAEVFIDFETILMMCVVEKTSFKDMMVETITHEILHGIEELFEKCFDEKLIEKAIEYNRNPFPDIKE